MTLREIYKNYPASFPLPLLLDGACGTELIKRGMPKGASTMVWAAEHPEAVVDAQGGYVSAGSDALYTPTFGGTRPMLARSGAAVDDRALNRSLAALTVGRAPLTGGDLSPTGLFIEPWGDAPFEEVVEVYARQSEALAAAGVDFIVSETNISLYEAKAAVLGARKGAPGLPIFVTMTVDERGRTLSGETLPVAFVTLADLGIAAFGANCSAGPDGMAEHLLPLVPYAKALGIPLIAKPNAGLPHEDASGTHFDMSPDAFADAAKKLLDGGILILGGCCGTDPAYIAKLRALLDAFAGFTPSSDPLPQVDRLAAAGGSVVKIPENVTAVPYDPDAGLDDSQGFAAVSISTAEEADALLDELVSPTPLALHAPAELQARVTRLWNGKVVAI